MATNKLTEVAGLVAHAVMGATIKDKDGNDKIVKPDGDANYLDLRDIVAGSSGTGGGDNPENPDNPSAGADYYAGSLADGEITERNLEWSGTDDPTKDLTVTFKDDPGSNPFDQYSGLTILGHIQKTVMTSGTKGAISNLELNYDPSNATKDGYFTTTSPYPIYISQSDIASGQELDVPINGIGEGLEGDNTKPAIIHLKYNADKTMTISHEDGYVNDGSSAGATGANYSFVVEIIATFSTQKAVAQLPPSVNLFSGSAVGNVLLSGPSTNYDNIQDGLLITLSNLTSEIGDFNIGGNYGLSTQVGDLRIDLSPSGLKTIKIPKEQLTVGNSFDISDQLSQYIGKMIQLQYKDMYNNWSNIDSKYSFGIVSFGGTTINVLPNTTLSMNLTVSVNGIVKDKFPIPVIQVNTYKK